MKQLKFSEQFREPILDNLKRQTARYNTDIEKGDVVSAVIGKEACPFCTLCIEDVYSKRLGDFDQDDYKREYIPVEQFKSLWNRLHRFKTWIPDYEVKIIRFHVTYLYN